MVVLGKAQLLSSKITSLIPDPGGTWMWPYAFVTAQSHPFWKHKGEGASSNLPLITATL